MDSAFPTRCPEHHEHFLETGGGGKQAGDMPSLPSISQVAIAAANSVVQLFNPQQEATTTSPSLLQGAQVISRMSSGRGVIGQHLFPVTEVNNSTMNSSPAESTLTGCNLPLPVPQLPPLLGLSPDDVIAPPDDDIEFDVSDYFDANDDDAVDNNIGVSENIVVRDGPGSMSVEDNDHAEDDDDDDHDGGDSDDEGEVANDHVIALARRIINDDEGVEEIAVADAERIVLSHHSHDDDNDFDIDDEIGEPTSMEPINEGMPVLVGAPAGWFPPVPPITFTGYVQKHNAPAEDDIDNPGEWSMFTFTPKFDKKNNYQYHSTPTGARVVPKASNGKRIMFGWEFHYNDWKGDKTVEDTYARPGAVFGNLKPVSRMGCLDVDTLKRHGLTSERVRNDPMFFYQLLFPICAPQESGIEGDHRMPYFSNTTVFTNMYAFSKGAGTGYGHEFNPVSIAELVHWTAIPIRNGALDGRPSTLKHRWKETNGARYDPVLAKSMTYQRWRQIKRYFKLSMGLMEKRRGSIGYDPCAKYDYIWKCLIHNMNYVTKKADLDCTVDETTWGFSGYSGEAGGRLINKPVSKGECMCLLPLLFLLSLASNMW